MIVTKFDRTDIIINEVKKILAAFLSYQILITVIVTCWDYCDQQFKDQNKIDIEERLKKIKVDSVIFVGKQDQGESISKEIDHAIQKQQAQNIKYTEQDIFKNFDLTEYDESEIFEIECMKIDLVAEYEMFYEQAIKLIQETTCIKEKLPYFMSALSKFAFKKIKQLVIQFEESQIKTFDKLNPPEQSKAFEIHYQLKCILFREYESIVQKAHEKMNSDFHFSRFIRKCKFCHEIWFNITVCKGVKICGGLVDDSIRQDITSPLPSVGFQVTYNKKKLEVTPVALNLQEKNQTKILENLKDNQKNLQVRRMASLGIDTARVGMLGCKNKIKWNEMLPLTADELNPLMGLLDQGLSEYIKQSTNPIRKRKYQQIYNSQLK